MYRNQEIKRKTASLRAKEATIVKLWHKLTQSKSKKDIQKSSTLKNDISLKQLQRVHKRLIVSNMLKGKLKSADTVPLVNFSNLQLGFSAKNELVLVLHDKILCLEEEVAELKKIQIMKRKSQRRVERRFRPICA